MRLRIDDLHELPMRVRDRLKEIGGSRVTTHNELIIEAQRFRTQERNKQDAIERLVAMLRKAAERPKFRVKTRPTMASKRRRIDTKKKRGDTKKMRKSPID
jgi:ribosome-associated protein